MNALTLWVPFAVLNAPNHSASARLIWMLLARRPAGSRRLRNLSGLDPKTIALALAKLAEAPLEVCHTKPHPSCAALPEPLLADGAMSAGARLLYGQLQGVSHFRHPGGAFTYAALSSLTGSCEEALRRAVAELVATGWLTVTKKSRKSPIRFTLRNPVAAKLRARISSIRRRIRGAWPRGEALLREFLNARVDMDAYEDNAAPDFLLNPYTGELMELDRYYPAAAVAFEFQGAQHYEETDLATFEQTVKQVGRDAMKAFICKAQGIELVVLHPEDLSLKALEAKIPGRLPRRNLEGREPLITELEALASEYRDRTSEERARKAPRPGSGGSR